MAFPYKRILCVVDFDSSATSAMQEAGALARAADGVVILFHAQWTNPIAFEGYAAAELQKPQGGDASLKLEELASLKATKICANQAQGLKERGLPCVKLECVPAQL